MEVARGLDGGDEIDQIRSDQDPIGAEGYI